jgi:hypothetical protein
MSTLSPGNFYHVPGTRAKKLCLIISPLLSHFSIKVMNIFCFLKQFLDHRWRICGCFNVVTFHQFWEGFVTPLLKHWKYWNFENAHPIIQNYNGNVPGYCSQNFHSFLEIFNNFFGLFKINVITQNRGTLSLPNMLYEAYVNFKYQNREN